MKAIHYPGISVAARAHRLGCDQSLAVENLTDPDIGRVFATGASIESTIGAGYQTIHNAMANTNNQPGVEVFGLESYSQLNNFNLGTRAAIPRLPINNVDRRSVDLQRIHRACEGSAARRERDGRTRGARQEPERPSAPRARTCERVRSASSSPACRSDGWR